MSTSEALLFVTPHKYAIGIFSDNKIHSLMINSTCDWLTELRGQFPDVELLPPASAKAIADAEKTVGQLPEQLVELLTCSNRDLFDLGISSGDIPAVIDGTYRRC